jgi:hypothetical protein
MGDIAALQAAPGCRVLAARRGRFEAAGGTEVAGGFLEVTLDSGPVVVLDVGSDWTLTAEPGPWTDHFAEPLTDDNREFVRTHGKWSAVALSPALAAALVGARIESLSLLRDEMDDVVGVRLVTEAGVVTAAQWEGELKVEAEGG